MNLPFEVALNELFRVDFGGLLHEVIDTFVAAVGLVNRMMVHPREVFAPALKERATAIAIAHNHPPGSLELSTDDIEVTKRIVDAGKLLGIKVLDHLIITENGYFSFLEHRML